MVKIATDGKVTIQANKINVYAQQHNIWGQQDKLGGQGQPAPSPKPQQPVTVKLIYCYTDGTAHGKPIAQARSRAWNQELPKFYPNTDALGQCWIENLSPGDLTLKNHTVSSHQSPQALLITQVNQQKQSPWQEVEVKVPAGSSQGQAIDQQHTFKLHAVYPPILKNYNDCISDNFQPPCLTAEELEYFKNNDNNIIVFVHGYNVDWGNFGKDIRSVDSISADEVLVSTTPQDCTVARFLEDLQHKFPNIPSDVKKINGMDVDAALNGTESHNWLLHMEYNLNCAATGKYPFDWQEHGTDYTRILGIHWPGNMGKMNFLQTEEPARKAGLALVQQLLQLHKAGITINLITHSLGARVALTAMQTLAQQGVTDMLEHVFLWEAAVPDNALSPLLASNPDRNIFPQAHQTAKQIIVLYSHLDDVLHKAYRLAMGEQISHIDLPLSQLQLIEIIAAAIFSRPALGYAGPDSTTAEALGNKLVGINQGDCLGGHSYMRIPEPKIV